MDSVKQKLLTIVTSLLAIGQSNSTPVTSTSFKNQDLEKASFILKLGHNSDQNLVFEDFWRATLDISPRLAQHYGDELKVRYEKELSIFEVEYTSGDIIDIPIDALASHSENWFVGNRA